MSEGRVPERSTEPDQGSKPPMSRRAAPLPALARPLVSLLPSSDVDGAVNELPPTLLFNDVSDDAPMCDPNDPDCEVV